MLSLSGKFVAPNRVTLGQLCDVVGKYLENNPSKRNNHAEICILESLSDGFPDSVIYNEKKDDFTPIQPTKKEKKK